MVNIFTRYKSNTSTQKAMQWLEKHGISYRLICPHDMSIKYIKKLLQLSDGIDDLLLSEDKGQKTWQELKLNPQSLLEELSTNELINLLANNPILLRNLILFDDKRLLLGYNEEGIRIFLPTSYRQISRQTMLV